MRGREFTDTAVTTNVSKETRQMDFRTATCRAQRRRPLLAALAAAATLAVGVITAGPAQATPDEYSLNTASASLSTDQAGGHPDFVTKFLISGDPTRAIGGQPEPWADLRDLAVELPPGLLGNPAAFPQCSSAVFVQQLTAFIDPSVPYCPSDSQVGMVSPGLHNFFPPGLYRTPLYNLTAPGGESGIVARLGFIGVFYPLFLDIRLDPKRENALTVTLVNIPSIAGLSGSYTTVWGTPTDPSHDTERFNWFEAVACFGQCGGPVPSGMAQTPFMSNPTSCGPADVGMASISYQRLEGPYFSSSPMDDLTGCAQVSFEPTLSLQPTTRSAAAASGVDVDLQVPQSGLTDPKGLASAHLKKAVITMPEGVSLNASAADGLGSCSQDQIGVDRDERQLVAIGSNGAPVALSFGGQSTAELPQLASAAAVQAALEGLPNIAPGDVAVSGRAGGPWTVDFIGSLSGQDVPEITGVHSELQRLAVKAEGGTYTLTFDGDTTGALPFDADAAAVQAALEALAGIDPGDVGVSGGAGAGEGSKLLRIVFTGALRATDVPQITTTKSLTGSESFADIYQLAEGGAAALVKTVKQGGTLGFDDEDPRCPQSSKVGSGEITTPVLDDPLKASLYLADQNDNPFNSLLAGYMVAEGSGVTLKVAGKFDLDPVTGRIIATFDNNPQQPFSDLELHFKAGNRGVITTPSECGTYQSDYELVPWSGNDPTVGTAEFTIDQNCDAGGFAPGFNAGSTNPLAGSFTTFALRVTRNSGSPQLTGVMVNPPLGLTGKLAGIPYCPDSALAAVPSVAGTGAGQLAAPACAADSQIGTVVAGAGSGSPFYVQTGKVYLAGPYKGAPLSMAILAPAVAGPFDLGNVVVRTAIQIDPATAQLHAISDPLPTFLHGIPLDLRDVRVLLDRSGFAMNPTSCEAKSATGTIEGTGGAVAQVSDRFQVGECAALGFKPKMSLRLKGGTKRGKHPALTAVLRARPGDANISRISVAFPSAELLDQAHIGTVCTRVQFAADACPAGSIYGKVTATTPLLDYALTGNVYLRSSSNKLPDLVTDLRGPAHQPIKLETAGRTDTVRGGLRNTFEFIPDAPITRVVLRMRGGKKGLLVNSTDLCAKAYRATVNFAAHNGRTYRARPKLRARCGATRKGKRRGHRAVR